MAYLLKIGSKGLSRLKVVNQLYNKESLHFLKNISLKSMKIIVDAGCGNGIMTTKLAKLAGPKATIIAMDQSSEQIQLAKHTVMKANLTNVEFITDDVNHITQYDLSPDLIYSRLLLIHQEDPLTTLENYRHILKPRGLLVCEEPITSHSFAYPNNPAFKEHLRLYTALGKINQRNFDLGNVLPEFFQQKALTILKYRKVINTFSNSSAKKIAYLRTKECADKYLSLNLIDSNRLEKLLGHLQAFYKDKNSCCSGVEMVQIIGRK